MAEVLTPASNPDNALAIPSGWSINRHGDQIGIVGPVSGPGGGFFRNAGRFEQRLLFALADALLDAGTPPLVSTPAASDRAAIRMLVDAGLVTEEVANEALCIAHGFAPGPLTVTAAPQLDATSQVSSGSPLTTCRAAGAPPR